MTCFNRREQTLLCLRNVYDQMRTDALHISVTLVDDGSTDGTAEAIAMQFPFVNLVKGSGHLYWNQGMRLAFAHAQRRSPDAYLWLNDDTMLYPHAITRLTKVMDALEQLGTTAIVTGSTCDHVSGGRSYGGFRWSSGWLRHLVPVDPPASVPVPCDTMNGNCTLIPRRVAEEIGNLDPAFQHAFGDMDYGFRARAAGFSIYVAPGFVGSCSDNSRGGTWRDRRVGFRKRWSHLHSPKGSPYSEWRLYCKRHLGVLWPLYTVSPYVKTIATAARRPGWTFPMKITWKVLIKIYVAFCICMDADVFLRVFGGITPSANGRSGIVNNPIMFCFTAALILGTLGLLVPGYKRCLQVLLNNPWLTGLYVWSVLSIFWSATPAMIVRGGLSIWAFLLCGVISSRYLETGETADLVCRVVLFLALLSIGFQLYFPVRETMAPGWTGVYGEKNHLGIGMGVGLIAHFASARRWTAWRIAQVLLLVVMLGLSQSATSMVFTFAAACLYAVIRLPQRIRPLATSSMLGSAMLAYAFIPHLAEKLFDAAGKNTNFTGRDVIWRFTWEQWKMRPILGYGLYSFWEAEDTLIQQWLGWNPRQAHNGFLEIGVTLGGVGVVLLLGSLVSGVQLILRARRLGHHTAALWLTLSWVAIMIDNITEADFMIPGPLWFTYCLVYFITYAELRRETLRRTAFAYAPSISSGFAHRLPPALALLGSGGDV